MIQGDCHKRSKRSAEEEDLSLETFADLQVEDSYKRVICVAIIGEVGNPQAPLSKKAMKFEGCHVWPSASTEHETREQLALMNNGWLCAKC